MTPRITSPDSAVAATPYVLGFTPQDSLVFIFTGDNGRQPSLRVDLPDQLDLRWLTPILSTIPRYEPTQLLLIAYADTVPMTFAQAVLDWVMAVFDPVVDVLDGIVVHDGQMHSLLNSLRGHGDPTPMSEVENHPVVAECVASGMSRVSSREVLQDRLEFVDDEMSRRVADLLDGGLPLARSYQQSREMVESRAHEALLGTCDLTPFDVMVVGMACADVFARDPLITLLLDQFEQDRDGMHLVMDRLAFAVAHLPDEFAGPTAATLGLLSWSSGEGAQALVACDRAMSADPTNTLGPLVADALSHGMPPETWSQVTGDIPMDVLRGQHRSSA